MYKEIAQSNLLDLYQRDPFFHAAIKTAFHSGMSYTEALEAIVLNQSSVIASQNNKALERELKRK